MKSKILLFDSETAPHQDPSAVDLGPVLEECMYDTQLLEELITLFDRNALEFIGAAKVHLNHADFKQLGQVAHKIKTGLAMMRSDSLHAIIELIQKECDGTQDPKHLEFLCECFATEYPVVKGNINAALAELKQG